MFWPHTGPPCWVQTPETLEAGLIVQRVLPASSKLELCDLPLRAGPFEIDGSWDSDTKANPEDRTVLRE